MRHKQFRDHAKEGQGRRAEGVYRFRNAMIIGDYFKKRNGVTVQKSQKNGFKLLTLSFKTRVGGGENEGTATMSHG